YAESAAHTKRLIPFGYLREPAARSNVVESPGGGGGSPILLIGDVVAPGRVVALLIDVEHGEMGHETRRSRAVPVILAGLEEHAVAGTDHLDRSPATLGEADALDHVDRLAVGVGMPCGARARREVDAARAQTGGPGRV